jgi:septum formation protein
MNTTLPLLLLASNSPRRRELLALGGWMFGVDVSNVDETLLPDEAPGPYVRRLAEEKARAVQSRAHPEQVIIGADTSVVIDGDILGKPGSIHEAHAMLARLRGRTHQVYTGIATLRMRDNTMLSEVVITDVPMRNYSDEEMERYILSGDPMDKAGAYGIQNPYFQPVAQKVPGVQRSGMEGCYASVMGLPLCSLTVLLRQMDVHPRNDVAGNCQSALNYQCPISQAILRGGL